MTSPFRSSSLTRLDLQVATPDMTQYELQDIVYISIRNAIAVVIIISLIGAACLVCILRSLRAKQVAGMGRLHL